jgi:hypothetical protein
MMATTMAPSKAAERREKVRRLASYWNVAVVARPVCRLHAAPLDFLTAWIHGRPAISLVHGPRGGGKSYLAALATHVNSMRHDRHGASILGGSLAQSEQVYGALSDFEAARRDSSPFESFTRTRATYITGSEVSILAASRTSVRGPHVPTLILDEVDEIDPEIRESATGMCMERRGVSPMLCMLSTWHRVDGPMGELLKRAEHGEYPSYTFCAFDVLERCPESRSGRFVGGEACYEHCPACPIRKWCHAERDRNGDVPLAKLSAGHYTIRSLITQAKALSERAFEADMLCRGPRADGAWFTTFSDANIDVSAEYDPRLPVHLAIDNGMFVGAVFFQVQHLGDRHRVTVFDDYLAENPGAEVSAHAILARLGARRGTRLRVSTDSAGGARNPIGPTVLNIYQQVGLRGDRGLECWPKASVVDTLATVEALVCSADGTRSLFIHPDCRHLIAAMKGYRRAKHQNQWMDYPADPQHPAEELVDSLKGGLRLEFPDGLKPPPQFYQRSAASMMY